jgi:CheY-like chemotaxis protein
MHRDKVILVVDDTTINRMGTAMTVKTLGYGVEEVASGSAALDKLKSRRYAAVLMDLHMPDMDGLECAAKIRALETGLDSRIPIIAFSSTPESDVKQNCIDAGMDAFLDKACSSELLGKTLTSLVP